MAWRPRTVRELRLRSGILYPARLLGLVVELLEVEGGELVQFDAADVGDHMVLDVAAVVFGGGVLHGGLAVVFIPEPAPVRDGVLTDL